MNTLSVILFVIMFVSFMWMMGMVAFDVNPFKKRWIDISMHISLVLFSLSLIGMSLALVA